MRRLMGENFFWLWRSGTLGDCEISARRAAILTNGRAIARSSLIASSASYELSAIFHSSLRIRELQKCRSERELVVDACTNQILGKRHVKWYGRAAISRADPTTQIHVQILNFRGPVLGDDSFKAASDRPAEVV